MNLLANSIWYIIFGYAWYLSGVPIIIGALLLIIILIVDMLQRRI